MIDATTKLLLLECRNELARWSQMGIGQVLLSAEDTGEARELAAKVERHLHLPLSARRCVSRYDYDLAIAEYGDEVQQ